MRIPLVAAILSATIAPALAIDMDAYRAARAAENKALCDRLGGVKIGQTAEGVRKSCWGKPARVNETMTAGHRHEQWVYGTGHYVYLTDGLVTAAQTAR